MPTTRPRHQVTETDAVAHALDVAARTWPDEPRSKLLVRLLQVGSAALEHEANAATRGRLEAIDATSGKYVDVFSDRHLADLRRDWPD